MTSFAVSAADVIQGGNINTNSSGGSNGQGEVSFSGGTAVFDADDIVVFEVDSPTADGEIGAGSSISDITIFDSYADYQAYLASVAAGTPDPTLIKYNYEPQNPGQTATIQSDISGLGDSYVRFNANIFQPTDGGPTLNSTLTIAPGTGLATNGGATVTLDRVRDYDLDYDSQIDAGTVEEGNSNFYIGDYIEIENGGPICFVAGTLVETPHGPRAIELLSKGDLVDTKDNGFQPIRWIGRRRVAAKGAFAPVHIKPGALGNTCALEFSQNHRVLMSKAKYEVLFGEPEVLVAAKFLCNDETIKLRRTGFVEYVHILFDAHELIKTDGVYSESLLPDWSAFAQGANAQQKEIFSLFPDAFQKKTTATQTARLCLKQFEASLI